jgi:hypothetical protein
VGSGPKASSLRHDFGACCYLETDLVSTAYPERAQIGETYTSGPGATAQFTFSKGHSSSLGVAGRVARALSFSQSGTKSPSSKLAAVFSETPANTNRTYYSYWAYGIWATYLVLYDPIDNDYYYRFEREQAKPLNYLGGADTGTATNPIPQNNCLHYGSGETMVRDTRKLVAYQYGASIADFIGINVSSQSGASDQVSITYTFAPQRSGGLRVRRQPDPVEVEAVPRGRLLMTRRRIRPIVTVLASLVGASTITACGSDARPVSGPPRPRANRRRQSALHRPRTTLRLDVQGPVHLPRRGAPAEGLGGPRKTDAVLLSPPAQSSGGGTRRRFAFFAGVGRWFARAFSVASSSRDPRVCEFDDRERETSARGSGFGHDGCARSRVER